MLSAQSYGQFDERSQIFTKKIFIVSLFNQLFCFHKVKDILSKQLKDDLSSSLLRSTIRVESRSRFTLVSSANKQPYKSARLIYHQYIKTWSFWLVQLSVKERAFVNQTKNWTLEYLQNCFDLWSHTNGHL